MAGNATRPTKRRQDDGARCARAVLEVVPQAIRFLRKEMRHEAGEGLSVPQFRVLAFIGRTPGASLSAVAAFVGVADPTASAMVERLVRRVLVRREGDPAERRRIMLTLTPHGAALLERARAHARTCVEERLAGLDDSELATLSAGLELLRRTLGQPAPVMEGS
jgi:DNA-binding MarR family transcriptional regulator